MIARAPYCWGSTQEFYWPAIAKLSSDAVDLELRQVVRDVWDGTAGLATVVRLGDGGLDRLWNGSRNGLLMAQLCSVICPRLGVTAALACIDTSAAHDQPSHGFADADVLRRSRVWSLRNPSPTNPRYRVYWHYTDISFDIVEDKDLPCGTIAYRWIRSGRHFSRTVPWLHEEVRGAVPCPTLTQVVDAIRKGNRCE